MFITLQLEHKVDGTKQSRTPVMVGVPNIPMPRKTAKVIEFAPSVRKYELAA